jgi:hypothetical protein
MGFEQKIVKARATLRWARGVVVDRVLYKRDERNFDRGMLAGLETAENAILYRSGITCLEAIDEAREGYKSEMRARRRD